MKTKGLFPIGMLMVALLVLGSCERMAKGITQMALKQVMNYEYEDSEEWGKVVTQEIETGDFKAIKTTGSVQVIYTQDSTCHVKVHGNEKAIERYAITVEDSVLLVKWKDNTSKINGNSPLMTLYVSARCLEELKVNGASDVKLQGFIAQDADMELDANGAVEVYVDSMQVKNFDVQVSGAGNIDIRWMKAAGDVDIEVNGAGDLKGKIMARDIAAEVNGAGDIDLDVDCQKIEAECHGAGDVTLSGKCAVLKKFHSRASSLNIEDLKVTGNK